MAIKLVIYDLDGTLIDSAPSTISTLNQIRNERQKDELPNHVFIPWLSLGGAGLISNSLELDSSEDVDVYLKEFRTRLYDLSSKEIPLFENVDASLDMLYNNTKLAICTSKARILVDKILEELKIKSYFDVVIAGDDLPTTKPNPAGVLACCDYLGIDASDAIFVGDSTVDQKTSSNANIKFAFFQHGYNDGVDENTAEIVFNNHLDLTNEILQYGK